MEMSCAHNKELAQGLHPKFNTIPTQKFPRSCLGHWQINAGSHGRCLLLDPNAQRQLLQRPAQIGRPEFKPCRCHQGGFPQ